LIKSHRSSAPASVLCGFLTISAPADVFHSDVAQTDPIVAHIFRTHFWFAEERLRTAGDPSSARWLRKVAEGTTTDHDSVATVVVPAEHRQHAA
jgi:hypothetical protein